MLREHIRGIRDLSRVTAGSITACLLELATQRPLRDMAQRLRVEGQARLNLYQRRAPIVGDPTLLSIQRATSRLTEEYLRLRQRCTALENRRDGLLLRQALLLIQAASMTELLREVERDEAGLPLLPLVLSIEREGLDFQDGPE